nr:hypothetical protein [Bacteroides intestinalis]
MKTKILFTFLFFVAGIYYCYGQTDLKIDPKTLAVPEKNGIWVQPAQNTKAQPIWGFADGIRIGIAPLDGPRGLIRIYTPYLGHDEFVVTNFIAFEPIDKAKSIRGLSELEWSELDNVRGKRFWSSDTPEAPSFPDKYYPAHGIVTNENGVETLTVYFFCETFDNGADVYVRIKFTAGKPYEFEITGYITEESDELSRFILTATMGNKARLRTLYLANGKTKEAGQLWPTYTDSNFTEHNHTSLAEMIKDKNGGVWFIASPDEEDPTQAVYADDTHTHWKYTGKKATQYWYCPKPGNELEGVVNGRYTYWASKSPIPGGISYENFELTEPFHAGQSYIFGISPFSPEEIISGINLDSVPNKL